MSNVAWANDVSGDFGAAADWYGGTVPTSSSNVTINTATVQNITFQSGDDFTVNSLTVGADNFAISGGTLNIAAAASFAGEFSLTGGIMTVNSGATFTNGFYQEGGTLQGSGAIAISGSNAQTGGQTAEFLYGSAEGSLQFTNNSTLTVAYYTFGGATRLVNNGVITANGLIMLGDSSGADATINNAVGATFNIANNLSIIAGANSAGLVNAGTLEMTVADGVSQIDVTLSSTGTINVADGTLEFSPDFSQPLL